MKKLYNYLDKRFSDLSREHQGTVPADDPGILSGFENVSAICEADAQ